MRSSGGGDRANSLQWISHRNNGAAFAASLCFVLLRLLLAADANITEFVRAAWPYAHRRYVPPGLHVFPENGYDGQFYYRLAAA